LYPGVSINSKEAFFYLKSGKPFHFGAGMLKKIKAMPFNQAFDLFK